ncbi:hypothetical protein IQ256_00915 [cf. Phormidesmis sp. LEGE 11477]|nr:hypothetical protein [cf. Phormidesmis sp. LEGE 11477]
MFTPVETKDGSNTFYSDEFGEWFHSREGARHEAQRTYIEAANISDRAQQDKVSILDVCYGLGYNTAAAMETILSANPQCFLDLRALEIDVEVARSAIAHNLTQHYSPTVEQALKDLANHYEAKSETILAQLLLGDARQQIQILIDQAWQADVIFLDPFSPPHCPQLWTLEFLGLVAKCLNPNGGVLVTYSCAAAVRSALKLVGLSIGSTAAGGRQWPGTIAGFSLETLASPSQKLSQQEQEHLKTKAAVPYRDPTLSSTATEILERRSREQLASDLIPTGPWRKEWQKRWQKREQRRLSDREQ